LATSGLAVLFFSPNDAQSQGYHLGLQLAPNISMAEPRELSHEAIQSEAHFGYGFVFDAMFTDKYAIGTGVNVFYNGGITQHLAFQEDENGLFIEAVQLVQQQQYVEIPLTFKMRTNEIGYTTSFATLDSLGSVMEVVFSQPALEAAESEQVSMADRTRLFRPSMIIGLGAERRLTGSTALVFALRYNVGLRSQYEDFGVLQSQAAESLVFEFDSTTGEELPVPIQMQGKTGQIELCFGLMF